MRIEQWSFYILKKAGYYESSDVPKKPRKRYFEICIEKGAILGLWWQVGW